MSVGTVTGEILVDGHPRNGSFQRETGYVQQADIHTPISTVREALNFSATLRQPKATPLKEKLSYVDQVLNALEMESYADAIIGTRGDGKCSTTQSAERLGSFNCEVFADSIRSQCRAAQTAFNRSRIGRKACTTSILR